MTSPTVASDMGRFVAFESDSSFLHSETLIIRTKSDRLTPINALPVEILLCIFQFAADTEKPKAASLGWIRTVTHVCQLWRDVALASATLWARIYTDIGPEWTEEMFRRSFSALLDINHQASHPITDSILSHHLQLPGTMCNVRSLHLSITSDIIQNIRAPAPSLCKLYISTPHHLTPMSRDRIVSLPVDLFAFHAPKLQSAKLFGCMIPWESPIFNDSLTLLAIGPGKSRGQVADALPSSAQMYGLLKRIPLLEVFYGILWLPAILSSSHSSTAGDDPVRLVRLKKVVLAGHIADCIHFLRCITFPIFATISLTCVRSFDNTLSLHDIIPFLVDRLKHPDYSSLPLPKLAIIHSANQKQLGISLFVTLPLTRKPSGQPHSAFLLDLMFPTPIETLAFLQATCRALPLHRVVDLLSIDISGCHSAAYEDSFWTDLFWEMQSVRRLEVLGLSTLPNPHMSARTLLLIDITHPCESEQATLETEHEPAKTATSTVPIFPALQSLTLSRVHLPDKWDGDLLLQFCEKLTCLVELRTTRGGPLREVKVVFYDPNESLPVGYLASEAFRSVKTQLSRLVSKVTFHSVQIL